MATAMRDMSQVDYFLKLDGIDGESTDSKHSKEIDVMSFSWRAAQSGTSAYGGGGGAGKVAMDDFSFVMKVCKASPKLMLACASGEHIKTAILTCRKAGKEQQEFMKITMTDVLVSNYQTTGGTGDVVPVDNVSLNFAKIEFEYKEQKGDGTLGAAAKSGWDLKKNVKV